MLLLLDLWTCLLFGLRRKRELPFRGFCVQGCQVGDQKIRVFFHSKLIPLLADVLQQTSVVVDVSSCTPKWLKLPSRPFPVFWGLNCCRRDSISPHGSLASVVSLGRPGTQVWGQTPSIPTPGWSFLSWQQHWKCSLHKKSNIERPVFKDLDIAKPLELNSVVFGMFPCWMCWEIH